MEFIRSILSVPGDRPDMYASASSAGADLVHFDLEDSVLPTQRSFARDCIFEAVQRMELPKWSIRVNQFGTDDYNWDAEHFEGLCEFYFLPKVETAQQIDLAAHKFQGRIVAIIETAIGVRDCDSILNHNPDLAGVVFGESDFCASMRMGYRDCPWARQKVLLAAKANGLPVFASPWPWTKTVAATHEHEGFDGQICLNPDQVAQVNGCYGPSQRDLWLAQHIIKQHNEGKHNFYLIPETYGPSLLLASEFIHWAKLTMERARRYGCGLPAY